MRQYPPSFPLTKLLISSLILFVPCVFMTAVLRPRWLSNFPLFLSFVFLGRWYSESVAQFEMSWQAEKAT